MSVGAIGAPRVQVQTPGLVGAGVGAVAGLGVAAAGMKSLHFPLPVAAVAGAAIGGPIAAVSLMNHRGEPNDAWQSMAIGAGPLGVIGGALGAFGAGWDGTKLGVGIATGAVTFGLIGAAIGGAAHWATKPD